MRNSASCSAPPKAQPNEGATGFFRLACAAVSAVARGADAAHERKRAIGPRTQRSSTLNWCTTSRTAGPHGDPCQRIGKQAYEHLLLCGRFFQRNGAIGRLELSTSSSLCRRSTPMERGCATRRWANAAERGAPNAEPGARGGDQPRRRRPGAQHPRHRRRTRSARRRWQPGPASS